MEGKLNKELIEVNERNMQLENKVGAKSSEPVVCSHDRLSI